MKTKITILGCGTAGGVPSLARGYGLCDPLNPKNNRLRTSLLVERGQTRLLVDTSPDLRFQLLKTGINTVSAVLFTHDHADHLHGIDDLREINRSTGHKIPVYAHQDTMKTIEERFSYVFAKNEDQNEILEPPIYQPHLLKKIVIEDREFIIGDFKIKGFIVSHGWQDVMAYRFDNIVYLTDVIKIYNWQADYLKAIEVLIVGCVSYRPHPIHANIATVLEWVERLKPKRTVLTHMGSSLDYDRLSSELPLGVEPAFDGMVIEV